MIQSLKTVKSLQGQCLSDVLDSITVVVIKDH